MATHTLRTKPLAAVVGLSALGLGALVLSALVLTGCVPQVREPQGGEDLLAALNACPEEAETLDAAYDDGVLVLDDVTDPEHRRALGCVLEQLDISSPEIDAIAAGDPLDNFAGRWTVRLDGGRLTIEHRPTGAGSP